MTYEPREDSYLLAEQVKLHAVGKVLDMGTGSGIQAVEAAMKPEVTSVLAVDIDKGALKQFEKRIKEDKLVKIDPEWSNLFSKVKGKFKTIIFNPPYLPGSPEEDATLYAGKKGYEIIEKFLKQAKKYLEKGGMILLLYSSFSKPRIIAGIIKKNGFKKEKLAEKRIFFESLYVYKLT